MESGGYQGRGSGRLTGGEAITFDAVIKREGEGGIIVKIYGYCPAVSVQLNRAWTGRSGFSLNRYFKEY